MAPGGLLGWDEEGKIHCTPEGPAYLVWLEQQEHQVTLEDFGGAA